MARLLAALAAALLLWLAPVALVAPAWAGPVDWHELPASDEGRQWWDAGSLRLNRDGNLTVLSRFQPAPPNEKNSELYVMEIDCGQDLFRDTSINGIPQWGSSWQVAAGDGLIETTIKAVCAAGVDLLAGS